MGWKHPGRVGALLYAVAAALLGGVVTVLARLQVAKERGRRAAATRLPDGPIIVVSNHASYADGVLLALVCRRMGRSVRLLATGGVFRAPLLGRLVRRLGFIPVERGSSNAADSLEPAVQALAAGEAVGIFPEGRTTRDPNNWPERAKTGAVRLALRTGAPIVPVAMVGTHRVVARDHPVRTLLSTIVLRPRVLVEVGDPIDVAAVAAAASIAPDDVRELADLVMAQLVGLVADVRGESAPHPTGARLAEPGDTELGGAGGARSSRWRRGPLARRPDR